MARKYRVISTDGHIEGPPSMWTKYVPEKYRDWAPREIKTPEGGDAILYSGQPATPLGQTTSGGIEQGGPLKLKKLSYWNEDGSPGPGCGPAVQRLQEQDRDGIDAEVLYTGAGAGARSGDRDTYLAVLQAYNTFLGEEYCAAAPDRLIANGIIPTNGIDDAVAELKHVKQLGLRSVTLTQFPNGSGKPKPEDDRFWETSLELGIRIAPHIGFGDRQAEGAGAFGPGAAFTPLLAQRTTHPGYNIAQLITSEVFDRFPELKIYFAEVNTWALPSCFFIMDDNLKIFGPTYDVKLKKMPSDYIMDHCLFSFIRDPLAMRSRDLFPAGYVEKALMWGSDFPHSVGSFPQSQKWIDTIFDGTPEETKRRVLLETPAEFWGLDLDKELTPTPTAVGAAAR